MNPPPIACHDEARRARVAASPRNGIDFLEVLPHQRTLRVHFLEDVPADAFGLLATPRNARVVGGSRIPDVRLLPPFTLAAGPHPRWIDFAVEAPGDFSTYTLVLESAQLDPAYSQVDFSFKVSCPNRFDCRPRHDCATRPPAEPEIDYLARDFSSLRQALVDFVRLRAPHWIDRHEADLGNVLIEAMAHVGDHLSYYQDAVAGEAHLETARQRVSVRRHTRLVDYRLHDGASARVFAHLTLAAGAALVLPAGTALLTRIDRPLDNIWPPHPKRLPPEVRTRAEAAADAVFETLRDTRLDARLNEIALHTWGNLRCCLPAGATRADLAGDLLDCLAAGDFLLFEEVKGARTGLAPDADRAHRQIVRLTAVELTQDPLAGRVTRVAWEAADALAFPLCLSLQLGTSHIGGISVARGNLVLADHGSSRSEWFPEDPANAGASGTAPGPRTLRFAVAEGPLSFRVPLPRDPPGGFAPASLLPQLGPHLALPQIRRVQVATGTGAGTAREIWLPVTADLLDRDGATLRVPLRPDLSYDGLPDLLGADPFDPVFAVETDNDGIALLRFGDGQYGQAPADGAFFRVEYRVGSGIRGNIGADALGHLIDPGGLAAVLAVTNPLPAWGGTEPESIEHAQRIAPAAFHAEPLRAVTESDYARAAERHPAVSRAVARIRWTGSWWTVFVSVDPRGRAGLSPELEADLHDHLARHTQAGYDLEIDPPRYTPLDLELEVCARPDHFRAHVEEAVRAALGPRTFFHPDRFSFGEPLHLSRLYQAVLAVPGVASARLRRFRRLDEADPDTDSRPATARNLAQGFVPVGPLEILRLDDDPNFPENGRLQLAVEVASEHPVRLLRSPRSRPAAAPLESPRPERPPLPDRHLRHFPPGHARRRRHGRSPELPPPRLDLPPRGRLRRPDPRTLGLRRRHRHLLPGTRRQRGLPPHRRPPRIPPPPRRPDRLSPRPRTRRRRRPRLHPRTRPEPRHPRRTPRPKRARPRRETPEIRSRSPARRPRPPECVSRLRRPRLPSSARGEIHPRPPAPGFHPPPPLTRGDRLVVYKKGRAGVEEKSLDALVPVDDGTELHWSPPLQASHAGGEMVRWSRKCRLFGADAPNQWVQPKTESDGRVTWTTEPSTKSAPYTLAAGSELALDATYENLAAGTEVLVVSPAVTHRARIARVQPAAVRVGPFEGTVSRITLDPKPPLLDDLRLVVVYVLASPDFPFPTRRLDPVVEGTFLYAHAGDVAGLEPGRTLLVGGTGPGEAPHRVVLKRIDPHTTPSTDARLGLLRLEITPALPRLANTPVVAHGNIARATDGESVAAEVLGDGDAGTAFARFALARAPLTYVPRPGAPNGAGSTLELRVDGVRWTEIRDLVFAGPRDRVYTTSRDARETTHLHFGDGRTGATPVTGRANIVARYRHGLGRAGNVPALSLRTPLDRPLGLAGSTNYHPAEGGADPESDTAIRRNAPNVVRTFGRIVSLRDFEDAAREFPAVGKARAVVDWSGEDQVVYLVVAGIDGTLGAETLRLLRGDLDARRDLHRTLVLETHQPTGVEIVVNVRPAAERLPDDVRQAAHAALVGRLAFDRVDFGGTLHLAEIYAAVQDAPGVVSADVDVFRFANAPVALPAVRLGSGPLQPYLRFERRELPAIVDADRHAIVNLLPA